MHHAARSEYCRDIVELLLAHGADVNARDKDGRTPLDYASDLKLERMIELLVQNGGRSSKG